MPSESDSPQSLASGVGAPPEPERRIINIRGGDYAEGNIDKRQGTFIDSVQGSVFIEEAERAYDVRGLPNPFLGLRSFTYDDRDRYAGRQRTIEFALQKLTAPGEQRTLLFITGASGSGKSSFAQAGLLPALETYYAQRDLLAHGAIFRPSRYPLAGLMDALQQLGLPADTLDLQAATATPAAFYRFVQENLAQSQIYIVIIDQFEELFIQANPRECEAFFAILEGLPAFSEIRTHFIVTLRADYLPELFQHKLLYDIATAEQRIDLRAMRETELREAIQRPIQQWYPDADKRFEDALLEKLVRNAGGDAAYLPLLQVTLEDLWARGSLKLSAYGTLTDAIQRRAEEVYAYTDADGQQPRSIDAQAAIMQIFLDLVEVSLDDDPRRDVRRRRTYDELTHGSADRARLIEELCAARLLSKSLETRDDGQVEVVDIIHESLIGNWERLRQAIIEQRTILQQRVRFEQALREWLEKGRSIAYFLNGVRLAEAQELDRQGNVALRGAAAQELLRESIARREAERQRQLHRTRLVTGVLGVLLLAALAATVYALDRQGFAEERRAEADKQRQLAQTQQAEAERQRQLAQQQQAAAERQARVSRAQAITANAVAQLELDPERSILLAIEAISTTLRSGESVMAEAQDTLHQALLRSRIHLTLRGHEGAVESAAYSPDGRFIVTASEDKTAKVWEATTGQGRLILRGHESGLVSAAYSPDGRFIVTTSYDKTAKVWDATTGQERLTLRGHEAQVQSAAYSPDGRFIVTASYDNTAKVWDATTGQEHLNLRGHEGAVESAVYSPNERFIVTASYDKTAKVWDATTGEVLLTLRGHEDGVNSAIYSPDGRFIVTASADDTAKVWDMTTRQKPLTIGGHKDQVQSAVYSPDGRFIVTASVDATAKVWDATTGQERLILRGHEGWVNSAVYSPNGRFIVTASYDNTAKVWDAETSQERPSLHGHEDQVRSASYSPDGRFIVTASVDATAKIWDATTGQVLLTLRGHREGGYSAAYSPDGRFIVTASADDTAKVWDATTGQERLTFRGHKSWVESAAYSPDGRFIVTTSADDTAKVKVWDATTGEERLTLRDEDLVNSAAYSPDGRFIVTAGITAKVWDATTGEERLTLRGHNDLMASAAYSPDGRFIVTAGRDWTARVWDATTGQERLILRGHEDWVYSASYSPDGRYIVSASQDGTARQYVMDIDELLRLAQSRVTRQLTPAERVQFGLD